MPRRAKDGQAALVKLPSDQEPLREVTVLELSIYLDFGSRIPG
jgi:hypothetical protein